MSNRTKLKPCPFCGGEAKLLIVGKRVDGGEEWYVGCENENCSLHPHSTIPYASAEIAAEAWNKRTETTGSAPVGDKAAIRKALENSNGLLEELALLGEWGESARAQIAENKAALSEPLRNCDVGTEGEQSRRFDKFCYAHKTYEHGCEDCPLLKSVCCELAWAQMPYESEVE